MQYLLFKDKNNDKYIKLSLTTEYRYTVFYLHTHSPDINLYMNPDINQ